jgi:hypothetical protein
MTFEHCDLAISEVSHCGFLRGHFSRSRLKDPMVGFKKKKLKTIKWIACFKECSEVVLSFKSSIWKNFRDERHANYHY